MKMYLISDNIDTLTGMRLAGIDGSLAHTKEELLCAMEEVFARDDIAILLLTEKFSRDYPDLVNEQKLSRSMPLIIDVPDRHGSGRRSDFITAYVSDAIGLNL